MLESNTCIAQHFDIASLLSCLSQLRQENERLEDRAANLISRREHLLTVNARLSIPLNGQLAAAFAHNGLAPLPGQQSTMASTFLAPTPPNIGMIGEHKASSLRPENGGGRVLAFPTADLLPTSSSGIQNAHPNPHHHPQHPYGHQQQPLHMSSFPNFALAALQGHSVPCPSPGSRGSSGSPFASNSNGSTATFGSSMIPAPASAPNSGPPGQAGAGSGHQIMVNQVRDTHSTGSTSSSGGGSRGMDAPRR